MPVLALGPNPIVKGRSIAEREALQELASREAARALELGQQVVMRLFRHGQSRVSRLTRQCPSFMESMEVQMDSGGEIKAEGIAFDEEVRCRKNIGILTQHVTEMVQGDAQRCPT